MKNALLLAVALGIFAFAAPAHAGPRVQVFFNSGGYGCAPAYVQPCYTRPFVVYPAPVVYYRPTPVYYAPAPIYYGGPCNVVPYRAPIVASPIAVSTGGYRWRR